MWAKLSLLNSRHPQWWIAGAVALAWLAMLSAGHSHHGTSVLSGLAGWTLMAFAMTVPLTLPAIRHVAHNSIRRRRQWAMTLYVVAYLGVWVAFGVVALAVVRLVRELLPQLDERAMLVAVLLVAAGWQLTRAKRRALLACRRTVPLPPHGRRADAGCIRFGLRQAWRCVVSCWPLMLLMAVSTNIVWMVGLAIVMYAEERTSIGRRLVRPSAALLTVAATAAAVLG